MQCSPGGRSGGPWYNPAAVCTGLELDWELNFSSNIHCRLAAVANGDGLGCFVRKLTATSAILVIPKILLHGILNLQRAFV